MALYSFHRVLIIFAIAFDFFFTWFCIRKYNRYGDFSELLFAGFSSLITVGFVVYLVYFSRKMAKMRAILAAPPPSSPAAPPALCSACGYDLRGSLGAGAAACPECGAPISDDFRRKALGEGAA